MADSVQTTLGNVGSTFGGLTGKTAKDFGTGVGQYVTFMEVLEGVRLFGSSLERVVVRKDERQNEVRNGDVLFNGSSETPEEVALGAVVDFNVPRGVYLNSFCFGFRISKPGVIDPTYLAYFTRSSAGRQLVSALAQGATRYNIAKTKLMQVPLIFPSYGEQKVIAAALSDADDLIAALERLIAKKRAIKQGMMQELLTGRTRLPGFGEAWRMVRLEDMGKFLKGRGIKRDEVRSSGVPCIRYGEIYTTYRDYTSSTVSFVDASVAVTALPIGRGDILFAGSGETKEEIGTCVAYVGESSAVVGGDTIVMRGKGYDSTFLASLLNTSPVAAVKAAAGQGDAVVHINSRALAAIAIDLPSLPEQRAISEVLVDADREIYALERRLQTTRDIKQGMMQELLTGWTRLPVEGVA